MLVRCLAGALVIAGIGDQAAARDPGQRSSDAANAVELLERGRAALRVADRYAALEAIAQARRLQPANAEIAQALADVLMELGAPTRSAEVLGARTDIGVRSRRAAQRLRWATSIFPESPDPRTRFTAIDAALAEIEALLAEARAATPPDAGLIVRLRRDRVVALRQRERWQDVVDAVSELRAGNDVLPIYVLHAEADAMLELRRPREARRGYDEAIGRMTPTDRTEAQPLLRALLIGRIYAETDSEDFDAAFASVDELLAGANGPWRRDGPLQTPQANDAWLEALALAASARSYADLPGEAWSRIAPLERRAPALPWLRAQAADITAQQGWPRRAEARIDTAAALAPGDFGIRLEQVNSDLRRHRMRRAEARLVPLLEQGAHIPRVRKTRIDLDVQSGPSIRFELAGRQIRNPTDRGSGDGADVRLEAESSTLAGAWRVVGLADRSTDSLQEGRAERNRIGGGVLARWPDWWVRGLAWWQSGSLDTGGGSLESVWEPDDQWSVRVGVAKQTPESPLRADLYDTTADSVRGALHYGWNSATEINLSAQRMEFSDGNRREQLAIDGTFKPLDRPHFEVSLTPRADWQSNTFPGAAYFNPEEAWSVSLEARAEHVTWRVFERMLLQRLRVNTGVFDQRGFDRDGIGGAAYELTWRYDPKLDLTWNIAWSSNVYDGDREESFNSALTMQYRFGK